MEGSGVPPTPKKIKDIFYFLYNQDFHFLNPPPLRPPPLLPTALSHFSINKPCFQPIPQVQMEISSSRPRLSILIDHLKPQSLLFPTNLRNPHLLPIPFSMKVLQAYVEKIIIGILLDGYVALTTNHNWPFSNLHRRRMKNFHEAPSDLLLTLLSKAANNTNRVFYFAGE